MLHWIETLGRPPVRQAIGRRLEAAAADAYAALRWVLVVGFARFLAVEAPSPVFDLIYWLLAAFLMVYLAAIFLLRPEIPIFAATDTRARRIVQTLVNYALCMAAFMAVLWMIDRLVEAVAQYRFGTTGL